MPLSKVDLYPPVLRAMVRESIETYRRNLDAALEQVVREWMSSDDSDGWAAALVEERIRALIEREAKRQAEHPNQERPAPRPAATNYLPNENRPPTTPSYEAVAEVAKQIAVDNILDCYRIAGEALGDIVGNRLPELAASERELSAQHGINAKLCLSLAALVKGKAKVRDVITEQDAWELYTSLKGL